MAFLAYKMGGGLNLKAAPTDIADSDLQEAVGCRFDITGAVSSERGRLRIIRPTARQTVKGIIDQYIDGVLTHLVKSGAKIREVGPAGVTDTSGTFAGTDNITGATYRNYTYLCDGNKFKRWDGTTLEAVGLEAPTSALTATATTGGSLAVGDYKYWVSFHNGVAESNFSPVAEVSIADSTNDAVALTNIPTGGSTVKKRRIYRSDVNGQVKYFLKELDDNTTTTWDDVEALPEGADDEAEAGADPVDSKNEIDAITDRAVVRYQPNVTIRGLYPDELRQSESGEQTERSELVMTQLGVLGEWTDHTPPPDDMKHLTFVKEQFFGISDNKVWFSKIANPEYWPVLNTFVPGRRAAEQVLNLAPLDRDIVIFTDSNLYRLSSLGASFQASTVRLDVVDSSTGLAGEWGVCDLMLGGQSAVMFYGKDGLYITDGRSAREVSFRVEALFTNPNHPDYVDPDQADTIRMVSSKDRVWMTYNSGSRTLFMDFQNPEDPKFSVYEYGYTALMRDRKLGTIRGGDDKGWFYNIITSGSDDSFGRLIGQPVEGLSDINYKPQKLKWRVTTKAYPITNQMTSATVREVVLDIDTGGHDATVLVVMDSGVRARKVIRSRIREQVRINMPYWMRGNYVTVSIQCRGENARHLYGVGFEVEPELYP